MAMASTASTTSCPPAPSTMVDELRSVLASKGLVVKDSVLARLAKSKSFKGLSPSENLTLNQNAELEETETTQKEKVSSAEKQQQSQERTKETSESVRDLSSSSGPSKKDEKHDNLSSSATSEGARVLALTDAGLYSSSDQERKQRRSERFGTVCDDEKLKMRAARFGIANDEKEEAEKKRARAARFGIVDEDAKKKARLERFNKVLEKENREENEKRKARALRFATSTATAVEGNLVIAEED